MESEPSKVSSGFELKGVASAGGKVGGKMSRRPRTIRVGQPLTSQEMLFIADGISAIVNSITKEGTVGSEEIEQCVRQTTEMLMNGKWNLVFRSTTPWPMASLKKWKEYLISQWEKAYKMIADNNLSDEDNEWLRALRNVSKAYDVANFTKTKWVQEVKKA